MTKRTWFSTYCRLARVGGMLMFILIFVFVPSGAGKEKSYAGKILVIGSSPIHGDNLAQAKKAALSQALTKGIEDYLIRRLGNEGMINNFQRLVQEIIPGAHEEIENFHILAECYTGKAYKILVALRINRNVVDQKLRRVGLVTMEGPRIKVLFMVLETLKGNRFYWWKNPEEPSAMSAVEVALRNAFEDRGFSPINQRQSIPEVDLPQDMRVPTLTDENIRKWGQLFSADVVICGRTGTTDTKEIFMTLRALDVNRGDEIARAARTEPVTGNLENRTLRANVYDALVNVLASELTPAIVRATTRGHRQIHILQVTLKDLKTYKQFIDFRRFLRKNVTGIKSIKQTRVRDNAISIEIGFEGDENQFLERVLNHESLPFLLDFYRAENGTIVFEVE